MQGLGHSDKPWGAGWATEHRYGGRTQEGGAAAALYEAGAPQDGVALHQAVPLQGGARRDALRQRWGERSVDLSVHPSAISR